MLATNLKIVAVVVGTIALYTILANAIPQVESAVPEQVDLSAEMSVEELVAAGDELYHGSGGCTACHGLGTRAPSLLAGEGDAPVGARCADRVDGMACKAYLHESLVDPNGFVVEGFQPIMPPADQTQSPSQVWALVAFLQSQGGEVTVTPEDLQAGADAGSGAAVDGGGSAAGGGDAADGSPAAPATAGTDPMEILRANQCLTCHVLDGEGGPIGPAFDEVGARLSADAIRREILEPNAETSEGYESVAGTMPTNFGRTLTAEQLEILVRFLAEQQ